MKDRYVSCYFSGRFDAFDGEVDIDKLIEKVNAGMPLRHVSFEAAQNAIWSAGEAKTDVKIQWIKDNLDEIKDMGGDTEKAWRLYSSGRIDSLAHQLEADVLDSVEEEDDDEDDEDSEGEGDDDEDDEDDDEEEEGDYFLTDQSERPLGEKRYESRDAAKRAAMKLVRDGAQSHVEVHHQLKGRAYMQGQATSEGWSDV